MQPETKQCPYCSEEILHTAKKCKHCGEFLDGSLRDNSSSKIPVVVAKEGCFLQTLNIGCAIIIGIVLLIFILIFFAS
jgi:hypothetical protein